MKKYLLLFWALSQLLLSFGQEKKESFYQLTVKLDNAPFDSLFLCDYTSGNDVLFLGQQSAIDTWRFHIPDTVVEQAEFMKLMVHTFDTISNTAKEVRFIYNGDGREVAISNIGVEDSNSLIHASYIGSSIFENGASFTGGGEDKKTLFGDLISEDFELLANAPESDINVRSQDPYFSWFMSYGSSEKSYEEYLISYENLAKKYPSSRYLITYLSSNLANFKTKEDVNRVYANLSNRHKDTKWARKIQRYLMGSFQNMELVSLASDAHEQLVVDSSKLNLIVFSASYCIPCIEEIPILKKIHSELGKELVLTYVSIDEKKNIGRFEKLLKEYEIPWRTLYAFEKLREVEDAFHLNGIPHSLLVYPDGRMEIIDPRRKVDFKKLYSESLLLL